MKGETEECLPAVAMAVPRARTVKSFISKLMPYYAKYDEWYREVTRSPAVERVTKNKDSSARGKGNAGKQQCSRPH